MKKFIVFFLCACILLISSCGAAQPAKPGGNAVIKSIAFQDKSDKKVVVGGMIYNNSITVNPKSFHAGDIHFVVEDPEIVSITPGTKADGILWFDIIALKPGQTKIYAQTKDGSVKAAGNNITVYEQN